MVVSHVITQFLVFCTCTLRIRYFVDNYVCCTWQDLTTYTWVKKKKKNRNVSVSMHTTYLSSLQNGSMPFGSQRFARFNGNLHALVGFGESIVNFYFFALSTRPFETSKWNQIVFRAFNRRKIVDLNCQQLSRRTERNETERNPIKSNPYVLATFPPFHRENRNSCTPDRLILSPFSKITRNT